MDLRHEYGSMTMSGRACAAPLGGLSGEDVQRVYYYSLFPNVLLSLHPDYVMCHTLWPEGPGQTHINCEWLFDPQAMAQPGFDAADAVKFWDMTNRQDWHVCELSQLGVGSRVYAPSPYSGQESLLAAFDRQVLRALGELPREAPE
jgi:Rieske 2Fe-2S family protein